MTNKLCAFVEAVLLQNIQQFSCYICGLLGIPPSITATSSPLHFVSSDLLYLRVISPWQQAHERDTEEEQTERER